MIEYFKKAVELRNRVTLYNLGVEQNYTKIFECYENAAGTCLC